MADSTIGDEAPLRGNGNAVAAQGLTELPVLNLSQCAKATATVLGRRDDWTPRHNLAPFFSLGGASYMDAVNGAFAAYCDIARRLNPILEEHFGWLLGKLKTVLADQLEEGVYTDPRLCLPGFHIYLPNPVFTAPVASIHCDRQHTEIEWPQEPHRDGEGVLSLALPLCGGSNGAGLKIWDVTHQQIARRAPGAPNPMKEGPQPALHPYCDGTAVMHNGQRMHQAVLMKEARADQPRITLQAHLYHTSQGWCLYW